jgi:ATP-dependent protease ClpP protease subunit
MQRKLKNLIDVNPTDAQAAATSSERFKVGVVNQDDGSIDLLVYGVIGDSYDGLDARSVAELLADNKGKSVRVRINSPGGLAFDGITIHNALVKHDGRVVTEIEGIAASAAAVIAMAGDTVRITDNASLMIHRASGSAWGNTFDMLDMAEFLEILDGQIARTFAAKSGQTFEAVMEMMTGKRDGTTFGAEKALELGFADEIIPIRRDGKPAEDATDASGIAADVSANVDKPAPDAEAAAQVAAEQEAEAEAAIERLEERQQLWELETGMAKNRT